MSCIACGIKSGLEYYVTIGDITVNLCEEHFDLAYYESCHVRHDTVK
jgi:hypothetical protein